MKAGDRVLLPGWGGSPIKVGEEVSWQHVLSRRVLLVADVRLAPKGVLPLPRLGDPRKDPGVDVFWLVLGIESERVGGRAEGFEVQENAGVGRGPYRGTRSTAPQRHIKVRYHLHPTLELIIVFCPAFVPYSPPQSVIIHPHSTLLLLPACLCVRGVNGRSSSVATGEKPVSVYGVLGILRARTFEVRSSSWSSYPLAVAGEIRAGDCWREALNERGSSRYNDESQDRHKSPCTSPWSLHPLTLIARLQAI